jgi:hypothetical protein
MRINCWHSEGWPEPGSCELVDISITQAKKHLREKGGTAIACFLDRKYDLLGTRKIELKGDNSTKALISKDSS